MLEVTEDTENSMHEDEPTHENDDFELRDMTPSPFMSSEPAVSKPSSQRSSDGYRKRKRVTTLSDVNEQAFKYFEKKEKRMEERNNEQTREPVDPDMAYLQSLLPDMKAMDERKKRKFKMGVLELADKLLNPVNFESSSSQSSYVLHQPCHLNTINSDYQFARNDEANINSDENAQFSLGEYVHYKKL